MAPPPSSFLPSLFPLSNSISFIFCKRALTLLLPFGVLKRSAFFPVCSFHSRERGFSDQLAMFRERWRKPGKEAITDDGGTHALALSGLLTANSALTVYQDFLAFTFNCSVGIFVPNSPSVRVQCAELLLNMRSGPMNTEWYHYFVECTVQGRDSWLS